ncbi:hypothetical protein Nepgr_033079 [Nepenthes gracilis]|uniref:Uncharacterized protein n=1 Tax=Nepenthes gracilis TaxID=150966 RepID=A0AAD3TLG2_NEPGR|nr:hypothetical protein Nepgr_033079 [Nepenthes gracilis]
MLLHKLMTCWGSVGSWDVQPCQDIEEGELSKFLVWSDRGSSAVNFPLESRSAFQWEGKGYKGLGQKQEYCSVNPLWSVAANL